MAYQFVAGDTGSKIEITFKDAVTGVVIDLTSHDAWLLFRVNGEPTRQGAMTITDAAGGVAVYTFGVDDLKAGKLRVQGKIRHQTTDAIRSALVWTEYDVLERL